MKQITLDDLETELLARVLKREDAANRLTLAAADASPAKLKARADLAVIDHILRKLA